MHAELLDLLACPECDSSLDLTVATGTPEQVEEGRLTCSGCSRSYPVLDDIPYFAPDIDRAGVRNQKSTYSLWWDDYHDETSIVDEGHREFFHKSLGLEAHDFERRIVLDAGCGNGRFSFVVSRFRPSLLISFDISSGILHARRAISRHEPEARVAFVQGDLTRPPFRRKAIDVVFSWGVIHHTPDAAQTFSRIAALVRKGGELGIYVYEYHPVYRWDKQPLLLLASIRSLFLIRPLRFFCSRLPAGIVHLLFVPIYYAERTLGVGIVGCHGPKADRWNKDRYFRVVIDRFKTRYASEHQLEEVMQWFQAAGFDNLRVGRPSVSITGERKAEGEASGLNVRFAGQSEARERAAQ